MKWLLGLLLCLNAACAIAAQEINGHARFPLPSPLGETTSHSTKLQDAAAKSLVIPQAGEGDKGSLREFHIKSFVRGSQQSIISSHQGHPFVLALWSLDCTHCIDDMVLFRKLAKQYRDFDLVLVSTDTPEQKQEVARTVQQYRLGKFESWVFADSYAERLRYEIDPQWYGELPRTYFFDATGQATAVSGKIDRAQIERWIRGNGKHE